MSFSQLTFCGASIRGVNASLGWGNQTGRLTVQVVEDPLNGDAFSPPLPNTPVYFALGAFTFNGMLQQWRRQRSVQGNPVYEVIVEDPRKALEAATLILAGYKGTVTVPNLLNIYGWWENQSFGSSLANEGGIPWYQIITALKAMNSGTPYGGPLNFAGSKYGLDLSQVPITPATYRIGGSSVGLLEVIAQVCEDAGCDFFIELVGTVIRVRVVNRRAQPPLGTIAALASSDEGGTLLQSGNGLEGRNEVTSAFLVGGDTTQLFLTNSIVQFWGYDITGKPIVGTPGVEKIFDPQGKVLTALTVESMKLNSAPIADVVGSTSYQSSTLEMRFALVNIESWMTYMVTQFPNLSTKIGLLSIYQRLGGGKPQFHIDVVNFGQGKSMAAAAVASDRWSNVLRVYEFIKGYATEYYGKKYLVQLPFILSHTDSETLQVEYSQQPTDGGYLPEGSQPLGLSLLNQDLFTTPDGRFGCFSHWTDTKLDMTRISASDSVIEGGGLYVKSHADPQIVFLPSPAAVITLASQVAQLPVDVMGDVTIIGAIFNMDKAEGTKYLKGAPINVRCAPNIIPPAQVAVPLKSNIETYGPWSSFGAPGKVRFEQDSSLTPWNYGGWAEMEAAAHARIDSVVTNMMLGESGEVQVVGMPTASLGDSLSTGGPEATDIDIQYGKDGVTTTYKFQTFTPRFGVFSKGNAERIKRLGQAAMELRKNVREALREKVANEAAIGNAARTSKAWLDAMPKAAKRESPHQMLLSYTVKNESGDIRTEVRTATYEESIPLLQGDDDTTFQSMAAMSMNGLLRPFATKTDGATNMSSYVTATAQGDFPCGPSLDPWKGSNDVEAYAWGSSYTGLRTTTDTPTPDNARVLALRGPLVLSGWGYGMDTKKYPADVGGDWANDYLKRCDQWKTGPVDLLWDDQRGVWTCHGTLRGTASEDIPANGTGMVAAIIPGSVGMSVLAHNQFSSLVASGKKVIMNYIATENAWYVVAADC